MLVSPGIRLNAAGAGCSSFTQVSTVTGTTYNNTGLAASTSYSYRVRATDAAGNLSGYSNTASATPSDTTPPSAPSNLTATAISTTQINLSWTASTDNVGVTGYQVERCQGAGCSSFTQVSTVTGTTYNNTGLAASTSYSYRVRATDAAGNLSGYSNTASTATMNPTFSHLITFWPDNKSGAVSLTFDDGCESQYSLGAPALTGRGLKGTFFVTTDWAVDYTGWEPWITVANMGHEIGSHSMTHPYLTTLPLAQMQEEMEGSRTAIEAQVTAQQCLTFAYPFGDLNDMIKATAQNTYIAARGTTCELNSEPYDFFNVRTCSPDDGDAIYAWTDAAEQQGKWLVFLVHALDGGANCWGSWEIGDLTDYLDYLSTKDLWAGSFSAAVKYIRERDSANLSVVSESSDQIELNLTDAVDDLTYDEPLTIRSEVSSDWANVSIQQGDTNTTVKPSLEGTKSVIYYRAIPDRGLITLKKTALSTLPEPSGWYAGDMHVHRSCGGSPEAVSSLYNKMSTQNLAVISLLADMGNGEVQNPVTDLPLVNGQDDPISTPGRIVHWDAEWHWDATYSQYPHQALGDIWWLLGLARLIRSGRSTRIRFSIGPISRTASPDLSICNTWMMAFRRA